MVSSFVKLALVATSFAPVLLTIGYIRCEQGRLWPDGISYLLAAALETLLCWLLIRASRTKLQILPFEVTSTRTADVEIVGFVLAYLLPFIDAAGVPVKGEVFWFVIALLALLVWSTNSYHVNPMLTLFGFNFYEVEVKGRTSFVVMTRRSLRDAGSISEVVQLTDYMLLDASSRGDTNATPSVEPLRHPR